MSNMSFMEKLLDGVEVEWELLGKVIKLEKGKQLNKEFLSAKKRNGDRVSTFDKLRK